MPKQMNKLNLFSWLNKLQKYIVSPLIQEKSNIFKKSLIFFGQVVNAIYNKIKKNN